jgi:hypothetical protein
MTTDRLSVRGHRPPPRPLQQSVRNLAHYAAHDFGKMHIFMSLVNIKVVSLFIPFYRLTIRLS